MLTTGYVRIIAIRNYREQIPGGKFVLIVDEADAMYRTSDRHQVFEQALQQLMNLNPSMVRICHYISSLQAFSI